MASPVEESPAPILITGAAGFAGCWLVETLRKRGESVVGLSRRAAWPAVWSHLQGQVRLHACDLLDSAALARILAEVRPGRICHLAGFASAGASFRDPDSAWEGNLTATRRLCEAVACMPVPRPRLLWVGSGLVYGPPAPPDRLVDEDCPLRPDTPYAASKAAADLACIQAGHSAGLDIVRARPFNHAGPHQPAGFALPDFARQLIAIERGLAPPVLHVGDLRAQRDLSDVRDVAAAYALLLERGQAGEAYNIASGATIAMSEVLDRLIALSGLKVEIRTRADLLRPADPGRMNVDAGKLRRLGWMPRIPLEQTLADTLAAWRAAS